MNMLNMIEEDMNTQRTLLYIYDLALKKLPEGRLHCKQKYNGIQYYWYRKGSKKQEYIRKENQDLVFQLKYRRMLEEAIKTIEQNLKVQEKLLKQYKPYDPASLLSRLGNVYQTMPELLYHPEFQDPNKNNLQNYQLKKWEEERIHLTSFGLKCKSKSEALIGELINVTKIKFLYETKLVLKDEDGETQIYYPDFTFFPPKRDVFYWEHLGRLDLKNYRKKNFKKLADYHFNDILIPDNLILTMESKNGALDVSGIVRIITGVLMPMFYKTNTQLLLPKNQFIDIDGKPLF